MTLVITRTTRRAAIATLLFFGGQLSGPAVWAQAPSAPAAGAPPKAAGAPATPATPSVGVPAAPPEGTPNRPWPRGATEGDRTYTVYQPQVEKWDDTRLSFRAAFSIENAASPVERFGVVWFSARAEVDKVNRLVGLTEFKIDKVAFPSEPDRAAEIAIGFVAAFVAAAFVVRPFLSFVRRSGFAPFAWYRIACGIALLMAFPAG